MRHSCLSFAICLFCFSLSKATVYTTTGVDTWDVNGAPPAGWLTGHTVNIGHNITNAGYTLQADGSSTTINITAGNWSILAVTTNGSPVINITGTLTTSTSFSLGVGTMTINSGGKLDIGTSFQQDGAGSTTINNGGLLKTATTGSTTAGTFVLNGQAMFAGALTNNIAITGSGILGYASISGTGSVAGTITLPVELINFDATKKDNMEVALNWATASEINSDYYSVMRSADAKVFESIGTIQAAGNSTHIIDYNYIDQAPIKGINYYQLVETDRDGQAQKSKVVAVDFTGSLNIITQLYPNPVDNAAALFFSSSKGGVYKFIIANATGLTIYSALIPAMIGENRFHIAMETYNSGIYFITLIAPDFTTSSLQLVKK